MWGVRKVRHSRHTDRVCDTGNTSRETQLIQAECEGYRHSHTQTLCSAHSWVQAECVSCRCAHRHTDMYSASLGCASCYTQGYSQAVTHTQLTHGHTHSLRQVVPNMVVAQATHMSHLHHPGVPSPSTSHSHPRLSLCSQLPGLRRALGWAEIPEGC